MKENGIITYKGQEYPLEFNLNVMEKIQEEYGTIEKWASLTDGRDGEVNLKALIFGIREMVNEGIDIENEEKGTNRQPLTLKQIGRLITEMGVAETTEAMNETVIASTSDGQNSKNA